MSSLKSTWLDRIRRFVTPDALQAEHLAVLKAYDAARRSLEHKALKCSDGPNEIVSSSALSLRQQARKLQQDNDIANSLLHVLTAGVIGEKGISVEPQPRTKTGEIHKDIAEELSEAFEAFSERPDTTGRFSRAELERLAFIAFVRDGEIFGELVLGHPPNFEHPNGKIPFSIQPLEADFIPFDSGFNQKSQHGIHFNAWQQPVGYDVYLSHPLDDMTAGFGPQRYVDAKRMLHFAHRPQLHISRGISHFAPIMRRLAALADYEESEIYAARIAAAITLVIQKELGVDDVAISALQDRIGVRLGRGHSFELNPGEKAELLESKRPSALLTEFRETMVRSVCAGMGVNYSSVAKRYEGSYSSQRQEMVESYAAYGVMSDNFIRHWTAPIYQNFINAYAFVRAGRWPADLDQATLAKGSYQKPVMPWIDPNAEAKAAEKAIEIGIATRREMIRKRGGNPVAVEKQRVREQETEATLRKMNEKEGRKPIA